MVFGSLDQGRFPTDNRFRGWGIQISDDVCRGAPCGPMPVSANWLLRRFVGRRPARSAEQSLGRNIGGFADFSKFRKCGRGQHFIAYRHLDGELGGCDGIVGRLDGFGLFCERNYISGYDSSRSKRQIYCELYSGRIRLISRQRKISQ